jgi:hypothetical protein
LDINFLDKLSIFLLGYILIYFFKIFLEKDFQRLSIFNISLDYIAFFNIIIFYFLILVLILRLLPYFPIKINKKIFKQLDEKINKILLKFIAKKDNENNKNNFYKSGLINDEPIESLDKIKEIIKEASYLKDNLIFKSYKDNVDNLIKVILKQNNNLIKNSSYTICIDAAWGHGKTSFINVLHNEIIFKNKNKKFSEKFFDFIGIKTKFPEDTIWIKYNPWHFSNHTELIEDFFQTLENRVGEKYGRNLKSDFRKYIRLVTPIVESSIKFPGFKELFNVFFGKRDLIQIKEEITEKLSSIEEKIVIVLDDIDRLEPKSIYEILKLVKLVSDFPNIIFILPFDYSRVSKIIKEEYRDEYGNYLQKIVNYRVRLKPYTYNELLAIFSYFFKENNDEGKKLDEAKIKDVFEYYILKAKQQVLNDVYNKKNENLNSNEFEKDFLFEYFRIVYQNEKISNYYFDGNVVQNLFGNKPGFKIKDIVNNFRFLNYFSIKGVIEDLMKILVIVYFLKVDNFRNIAKNFVVNISNFKKEIKGQLIEHYKKEKNGSHLIEPKEDEIKNKAKDYISLLEGGTSLKENIFKNLKSDFIQIHKLKVYDNDIKKSLNENILNSIIKKKDDLMRKNELNLKDKFVEYLVTPRDLKQLAVSLKGVNFNGDWQNKVDEVVEVQTFF